MEQAIDQQPASEQTVTFDPNKKYIWGQDDLFIVSGGEFGVLLNAIRAIINTPESQRILLASKANDIVENALARAVENGVVKEAIEEDSSSL
jgi:hypothetical protein